MIHPSSIHCIKSLIRPWQQVTYQSTRSSVSPQKFFSRISFWKIYDICNVFSRRKAKPTFCRNFYSLTSESKIQIQNVWNIEEIKHVLLYCYTVYDLLKMSTARWHQEHSIQTLIRNMTIVIGVPVNIAYIAGALQMYRKTVVQVRSVQYSFWQIDTQCWLLFLLSGWPGYQFTNTSVLLSDIQVNFPSSSRSFPPIQLQHCHQSDEHGADRKKELWWKRENTCQHQQYTIFVFISYV